MPPPPARYFGNPDTAVRLRFWFGRRLRDEVWLDPSDPETGQLARFVWEYHQRLSDLADAAQVPWLIEMFSPGSAGDEFYRYGTDASWDGRAAEVGPVPGQRTGNPHSGPLPRLDG